MTKFQVHQRLVSSVDNVVKYVLEDAEFGKNEVSVIRKSDKTIICMPTQTNCKMGCTFCHLTGTKRKALNLSADWIVDAVEYIIELEDLFDLPHDLLISFMGVGEPLMNLNELMLSIIELNNMYSEVGDIRFGISTIIPSEELFNQLLDQRGDLDDVDVKLHLSVHGITNRSRIVRNDIGAAKAIKMLRAFNEITHMPIEYHYTLVAGVNDSLEELTEFRKLVATRRKDVTVKFLTLSETNGCESTERTQEEILALFPNQTVEFYDPPGRDIGSSCGMFDRDLYNIDNKVGNQ